MDEKPIWKYAPLAIAVILIIAGLAKCAKKERSEPAAIISMPAEAPSSGPVLAQNVLRKPAVSSTAPVVIDEDLIPKPREKETDPDEGKSGPPQF